MNFTTKIFKSCQIIFSLFLAFFAVRLALYHYHLVTFPYPAMLREGAIMTNTDALVKGLNPYSMLLQPQYANEYGIAYPLLVWPWAKLFGTTLLVHRTVTAFFILASCILVLFVLKRTGTPLLLNIWAVLMFYASLLYPGTSTPCIDPGAMGTFLFLATVFIPWFCRYSYKSLIVSVLCGITAFYTKQYTMLGIAVMASYLFFFISKGTGLFYGLLWLVLASISVAVINRALPAYFDNCFFTPANMTHAWSSMDRLYLQIHLYTHLYQWTLILTGLFILASVWTVKWTASLLKSAPRSDIFLIIYAGLWASFVLYMSLGRHTGATLWYFFQLLSPFLLITAAWLFSRPSWGPVLCIPFLIYNLFVLTADEDYKIFNNRPGWPQVAVLISQHQHILNSSLIAPLLIEQNKEVTDNGMSEYFGSGGQRPAWIRPFLKDDPQVDIQLALFFERIKNRVENKEFDLIILQPSLLPLGVAEDIRKFYKYEGSLELYAIQDRRPYDLTFWRPL